MKLASLPLVVLLAMVSWASGQVTEGHWTYIIENGGATITASTATGDVTIPSELGGYAVKKVGNGEPIFGYNNTSVTSVSIPPNTTLVFDVELLSVTGAPPVAINGGSALELTTQTAVVISWTWKVSAQEEFDWLLCEVDGQEVAGISTKNGVWQTQVVQVPAGANVRWVYRKDGSESAGEDAGYLADVEFRSFTANQSFAQWAQIHGIYDPQQRLPKSGMQAMFGWLGGFRVDGEITDGPSKVIIVGGSLTYRYPISKTADGTQQILYSPDMSAWTTRRISQRVVSEDADRMVIEATAPSGTKGFFKVVGKTNQ
jgi:hypothetical protein